MRRTSAYHKTQGQKRLKVFTWHVHGSYLYYLSQTDCDFFIPVKKGAPFGYGGRRGPFGWGRNVLEVSAAEVKKLKFDCILFQDKAHFLEDQYKIFSSAQLRLPKIFLEHNPPREHPTDTLHPVQDKDILLVHVTHFNNLMWNNGITPTTVIRHGILAPNKISFRGTKERGLVVINNLKTRGRRLGADIFEYVKRHIPLDLVGMGSEELGGLGEVPYNKLLEFMSEYRFFFNPIRYTSLGLSTCEAMAVGLPVVGFATTEMAMTVKDGVTGFIHNDPENLIGQMRRLLNNRSLALRLGSNAHAYAQEHFSIERFVRDWENVFFGRVRESNFRQQVGTGNAGLRSLERIL